MRPGNTRGFISDKNNYPRVGNYFEVNPKSAPAQVARWPLAVSLQTPTPAMGLKVLVAGISQNNSQSIQHRPPSIKQLGHNWS